MKNFKSLATIVPLLIASACAKNGSSSDPGELHFSETLSQDLKVENEINELDRELLSVNHRLRCYSRPQEDFAKRPIGQSIEEFIEEEDLQSIVPFEEDGHHILWVLGEDKNYKRYVYYRNAEPFYDEGWWNLSGQKMDEALIEGSYFLSADDPSSNQIESFCYLLKDRPPVADNACIIEKPNYCPRHSNVRDTEVHDKYRNSHLNADGCLKRGVDWHRWCGFPSSVDVKATSVAKNKVKKSRIYPSMKKPPEEEEDLEEEEEKEELENSCLIEKPSSCPGQKNQNWSELKDTFQNSHINTERCMRRAPEFHRWCGFGEDIQVRATSTIEGEIVGSAVFPEKIVEKKESYCLIKKPGFCPRQRNQNWSELKDTFQNSHINTDRCMQRASEFHRWCGFDASVDVTATSVIQGEEKGQSRFPKKKKKNENEEAKIPRDRCQIEKSPECPARPSQDWVVVYDKYQNSHQHKSRCLQRAKEFHGWCGFSRSEEVRASFYSDDNLESSYVWGGEEIRKIYLNIVITHDMNGMGNEEIDREFLEAHFNSASSAVHGEVKFEIAHIRHLNHPLHTAGYGSQLKMVDDRTILAHTRRGYLTIVFSGPDSYSAAATHYGHNNFQPRIVMWGFPRSLAGNLLHELGHTLNFAHSGTFLGKYYTGDFSTGDVLASKYFRFPEGRAMLQNLAAGLNAARQYDLR